MQMRHTSAQMLFSVYGDWMPDHNAGQPVLLNAKLGINAHTASRQEWSIIKTNYSEG
jgi:hypothetical protein